MVDSHAEFAATVEHIEDRGLTKVTGRFGAFAAEWVGCIFFKVVFGQKLWRCLVDWVGLFDVKVLVHRRTGGFDPYLAAMFC